MFCYPAVPVDSVHDPLEFSKKLNSAQNSKKQK